MQLAALQAAVVQLTVLQLEAVRLAALQLTAMRLAALQLTAMRLAEVQAARAGSCCRIRTRWRPACLRPRSRKLPLTTQSVLPRAAAV